MAQTAAKIIPAATEALATKSSQRPLLRFAEMPAFTMPLASPSWPTAINNAATSFTFGPSKNAIPRMPGPHTTASSATRKSILHRLSRNRSYVNPASTAEANPAK